jgi:cytochrome c-type biogenesis protein CcmF
MAIGFGKFLGGYWAYETLGWGGYWAWDPVENTSIVPWVFGTALLHGMLVQQSRGSLKQANLFLAILVFLTVLYGTFLTRSGVLGEFSVHSFTAPAFAVYVMMLAFMGLWLLGGFGLFIARFKDIQSDSAYDQLNERPFGFFLAVILLIGAGTVICVGMSWPIISPLIMGKAASLKFDFYNRAMLPIATFMCLLMAITPLMPWRKVTDKPAKPFQKAVTSLAGLILLLGIPAAALAWHGGSQQIQLWLAQAFRIPASLLQPDTGFSPAAIPALIVFTLAAALGVLVNVVMFARTIRNGLLQTGAWLAHIAICIGFIGVVISSVFSSTEVLTLAKGENAASHGYQFTYAGLKQVPPPGRNYLEFKVTKGKQRLTAQLPYFKHMMGSQEQDITRPFIHKYLGHDLYLAASGWSDGSDHPQVARGETVSSMGFQIALKDFKHENLPAAGATQTGPIIIRPVLEVRTGSQTATVMPVYKISRDGSVEREPAMFPGGTHRVLVERVLVPNEEEGVTAPAVKLMLVPLTPLDLVRVESTYKPGINLVWLAGYQLLFASFLAFRRRARIAAQSGDREEAKLIGAPPAKTPTAKPEAKPLAKV